MKAVLIGSSILILLTAALRPLLRGRIDPRIQYALWLIVALRLLVPVEWASSAYSALALLDRAEETTHLAQAIGQTAVPIPAMSLQDALIQASQEHEAQGHPKPDALPMDPDPQVMDRAEELMRGLTLSELAAKFARPVWLGGGVLMAVWFLLVNFQLRRKLRRALPVDADCPLPVRVTPELPSPCLCGVFRPVIYVTPAALADPDRLRHVLAHELTHCRHRDHWWSLVRCACLCVYWFDPLVWWAAALSRQDCELACDEGAIRRLGEGERIPYGRTLVAMIAAGRNPLLQAATTMTGGKKRVKERVSLIARKPKTLAAAALVLAVVLGLAVGCTFTGAPEKPQEPLTADTLRERLMDVPEELREDVATGPSTQSLYSSALTAYWMERPWTDYSEGFGWLLTVYRWNQEEFEANYTGDDTWTWDCFAKGNGAYYVIQRASDVRWPASEEMLSEFEGATQADIDNNAYMVAFEAIREFAKQTVLATEGVEPYNPDEERQSPDTLRERLMDVPEELQDRVSFDLINEEPGHLADYWFDIPDEWTDMELWGGYMLSVGQCDTADLESAANMAYHVFARTGDHYYATFWCNDGRFEGYDEYWDAVGAIRAYAEQQVLATEGVEPVPQGDAVPVEPLDTLRERLLDVPEELRPTVTAAASETKAGLNDIALVSYWWDGATTPESQDVPTPAWLLAVYRCERRTIDDAGWPAINEDHAAEIIAQDEQYYYTIERPLNIRFQMEDGEAFTATYNAIRAYAEQQVLATEGVEPYSPDDTQLTASPAPEQIIQSVVNRLMAAPAATLSLAPAGNSRVYAYPTVPSEDYFAFYLSGLVSSFSWEEFDWGTTEEPLFPVQPQDDSLSIHLPDYSVRIQVWANSDLVYLHDDVNGTNWYHVQYIYDTNTPVTPFANLRRWFDEVELSHLRTTSVPNRGQSHEEIVREWLEGYEGVMTKAAPGSGYACTYVQPIDVHADFHSGLSTAEMEDFTLNWGGSLSADEYGKTWFTFTYRLIFVPVNQSTTSPFWAGNTWYYEEDGAPEGALTYSRGGYMWLTDEGWTCTGTGTGW